MSAAQAVQSSDVLAFRVQQQRLVAEFGLFALARADVADILGEAVRVAAAGLRTEFSKVLRHRREHGDLLVEAGIGWHAGVVGNATLGTGLESPAGYALQTGEPTVAEHLSRETRFRVPAMLIEHGIRSAINVVIGPAGSAYGVLEVDSTARGEFVSDDVAFLQALANVLSAGLVRAAADSAARLLMAEKDMMMREVHHRVTNSLQLVRTMLRLQGKGAPEGVQEQLNAAGRRIMSIAAVHRRLYQGGSVSGGDAGEYLAALLDDLAASVGTPERPFMLDAERVVLTADELMPLGLVVSELVTNAVKHGTGQVGVRIRLGASGLEVEVEDDGPGFGAEFAIDGVTGLGMRLVASIAKGGKDGVDVDRAADRGRIRVVLAVGEGAAAG